MRASNLVVLLPLMVLFVPPVPAGDAEATAQRMLVELSRVELHLQVPAAEVVDSPLTGEPEVVHAPGGALTAPAPDRSATEVALDFLRRHAGIYGVPPGEVDGLEVVGESVDGGGARTVRLRGRPLHPDLLALVDAEGRLLRIEGRLVP